MGLQGGTAWPKRLQLCSATQESLCSAAQSATVREGEGAFNRGRGAEPMAGREAVPVAGRRSLAARRAGSDHHTEESCAERGDVCRLRARTRPEGVSSRLE